MFDLAKLTESIVKAFELTMKYWNDWTEPVSVSWPLSAVVGFFGGGVAGLTTLLVYRSVLPRLARSLDWKELLQFLPPLDDGVLRSGGVNALILGGLGGVLLVGFQRLEFVFPRPLRWLARVVAGLVGGLILAIAQMIAGHTRLAWPWPGYSLCFGAYGAVGVITFLQVVHFDELRGLRDAIVGPGVAGTLALLAHYILRHLLGLGSDEVELPMTLLAVIYLQLIVILAYAGARLAAPRPSKLVRL